MKSLLRAKIREFCNKHGICTRCFARANDTPNKYCRVCLDYKQAFKYMAAKRAGKPIRKRDKKPKTKDIRKYNKLYKKKRLYKKVQKIKSLTRAIETGATL